MDKYELPALPYKLDALEPYCSSDILELHHGAHHAGYVAGANRTLESIAEARSTGDYSAINGLTRDLAFHVSGHLLHSLFWENMTPDGDAAPKDALASAIDRDFGSMDAFREHFSAAAGAVQGSGWAALSFESGSASLVVHQIRDHHANLVPGAAPLLLLDMWEHAYYLQYRNQKKKWIDAFWSVVNWDAVSARFTAAADQ